MFDFLSGSGDYLDLRKVLDPSAVPDFSKMSRQEAELWVRGGGREGEGKGGEREGREKREGREVNGGRRRQEGEEERGREGGQRRRGDGRAYLCICRVVSKVGRGVESGYRKDFAFPFYSSLCKATALPSSSYFQAMKMSLPLTPVGSLTQPCCGYTSTTTLSSMTRDVVREEGQPYLGNRGSIFGLAAYIVAGGQWNGRPFAPAPPHPFSLFPPHPSPIPFPLPPPTPLYPYKASQVMSFSSYPAFLSSLDDFYIMDK